MNDFVKKMLDYNRAFVEHGLYEKVYHNQVSGP